MSPRLNWQLQIAAANSRQWALSGPPQQAPDRSGHSRPPQQAPDLVGATGPQQQALSTVGHSQTSTARARPHAVGTTALQHQAPDRSGRPRTSTANQIAVGATGLNSKPDRSGHFFNCKLQITVGTYGPQLQARLQRHSRQKQCLNKRQNTAPIRACAFARLVKIDMRLAFFQIAVRGGDHSK